MAAALDRPTPAVVDLREIRASQLGPLLDEEVETWRDTLDWDFNASAELVRRFVQMQALTGFALLAAGEPIGYSYYVCEERKGLIGDLYIADGFRSVDYENVLLGAVIDAMMSIPFVRRIESQLMMLSSGLTRPMPRAHRLQTFPRLFMECALEQAEALPARSVGSGVAFEAWSDRHQDDAARVIARSYEGHIDSQINDQYRSIAGARRFLLNIVQYPGCGNFFYPASFVAMDLSQGHLCGVCLSSLVAADVGHITQICVTPEAKGAGIGYELLRRSMRALVQAGCREVSLTVTTANEQAISLYRSVGFTDRRRFAAYVWEGF